MYVVNMGVYYGLIGLFNCVLIDKEICIRIKFNFLSKITTVNLITVFVTDNADVKNQ